MNHYKYWTTILASVENVTNIPLVRMLHDFPDLKIRQTVLQLVGQQLNEHEMWAICGTYNENHSLLKNLSID